MIYLKNETYEKATHRHNRRTMNEYFNFQHHCVNLGLTGDQIMQAWDALNHIRTKDIHPSEVGFTLDIIQIAIEWNEGFEPDMNYIEKYMEL